MKTVQKAMDKTTDLFFPGEADTICALATPPGEGALALIRVSGPASFKIAHKLCPFLPSKIESHRLYFGRILHPQTQKTLDKALVSCFQKGRSFTGEESVELSCHGGWQVSQSILSALTFAGARIAQRGEFSYRAFMNGKMDLIQAESVLDLIHSRSPVSQIQALNSLTGGLSKKLKTLEQKWLKLLSHIEASLDFSEEDISPFDEKEQLASLKDIRADTTHLMQGFEQGLINRKGFSLLLLGAPNAGKSSLFNRLLEEEKAIVTKWPGTTRDILSAGLLWQGREFIIKDSAGFRPHPDPIEKEGIKKAKAEIKKADLLIFLLECSIPLKKESFFGLEEIDNYKTVICFSKADLFPDKKQREKFLNFFIPKGYDPRSRPRTCFSVPCTSKYLGPLSSTSGTFKCDRYNKTNSGVRPLEPLWVSTQTGEGIETLKELCFKKSEKEVGEHFLSTPRQGQILKNIRSCLNKAEKLRLQKASLDLVAFELREGLSYLKQLTGQEYNEEVIRGIFKEFCLGK